MAFSVAVELLNLRLRRRMTVPLQRPHEYERAAERGDLR